MGSLREAQQIKPILPLRLGNKIKYVRLHLPIAFVMGEGLNADQLSGRLINYNKTQRISRFCFCHWGTCDSFSHKCHPVGFPMVEALSVASVDISVLGGNTFDIWKAYLDSLPRHRKLHESAARRRAALCADVLKKVFKNHPLIHGMMGMDLGDCPNGLLEKLLVDCMHAYDHGLIKHFNFLFLFPIPASMRDALDVLASTKLTIKSFVASNYPRMTQSGGFSSYTMLSSDENVGQLLGLLALLHTKQGRDIMRARFQKDFDHLRKEKANQFTGEEDECASVESDDTDTSVWKDEDVHVSNDTRAFEGSSPLQMERVEKVLDLHDLSWIYQKVIPALPDSLSREIL